jgi:hypothetical protein
MESARGPHAPNRCQRSGRYRPRSGGKYRRLPPLVSERSADLHVRPPTAPAPYDPIENGPRRPREGAGGHPSTPADPDMGWTRRRSEMQAKPYVSIRQRCWKSGAISPVRMSRSQRPRPNVGRGESRPRDAGSQSQAAFSEAPVVILPRGGAGGTRNWAQEPAAHGGTAPGVPRGSAPGRSLRHLG